MYYYSMRLSAGMHVQLLNFLNFEMILLLYNHVTGIMIFSALVYVQYASYMNNNIILMNYKSRLVLNSANI